MVEYRPRKYYKELKKIPNVKLLAPSVDLFDILKHAKLTTVITSTAGWEAALIGKPVITFGDVFFNNLSMVKRCREIEKLPYLVKKQLTEFTYDEEEMIDFLSALFEDCAPFDYSYLWEHGNYKDIKNDPNFTKFVNLFADKLGLTSNK